MGTGRIFINYRRDDSRADSGRIYDYLSTRFPGKIFRDVGSLEPGVDWQQAIGRVIGQSDACVVVIGCNWVNITGDDGARRLDDPTDTVRREVFAALQRNMCVIPVLVGGAKMPKRHELPLDLQPLCDRNALELTEQEWAECCDRLARALQLALNQSPARSLPPVVTAKPSKTSWILAASVGALVVLLAVVLIAIGVNKKPNQPGAQSPNYAADSRPLPAPALATQPAVQEPELQLQPAPQNNPVPSLGNLTGMWSAQVNANGSTLNEVVALYGDHSFLVRLNGAATAVGRWQSDSQGLRLTAGTNFANDQHFSCAPAENTSGELGGDCSDQMNNVWTYSMSRMAGILSLPPFIAPARVDVSALTLGERSAFNQVLNMQRCTCRCGMTVAMCLERDPTCNYSPAIARNALMMFLRTTRG